MPMVPRLPLMLIVLVASCHSIYDGAPRAGENGSAEVDEVDPNLPRDRDQEPEMEYFDPFPDDVDETDGSAGQEPEEEGFDIFAEEEIDMGEPFTQEILDQRVAEILPRVEELRGWKFKHQVPAAMQSVDEFMEFAMAEFEREYGLEKFKAISEAYRMLGLIDPDLDLLETYAELLRSQVGGYYDPATKRFYMIDTFGQGALADIILAHELTHALDDQHFDLQKVMGPAGENSDREFAVRAVVEGSGTSLMNIYTVRGAIEQWFVLDPVAMAKMMEAQAGSLEDAPPFLIMTLALPYLEGNKFLTRKDDVLQASMAVPGDLELRLAFAAPPTSSEQVLHFEKYWDLKQLDQPTPIELPDLSAVAGNGWKIEDSNVLGELGAFVVTAKHLPDLASATDQLTAKWTNDAASGWDGDRYQSYAGPDGQRVMHWVSLWDSDDEATEFMASVIMTRGKSQFFHSAVTQGPWVLVRYQTPGSEDALNRMLDAFDFPQTERVK